MGGNQFDSDSLEKNSKTKIRATASPQNERMFDTATSWQSNLDSSRSDFLSGPTSDFTNGASSSGMFAQRKAAPTSSPTDTPPSRTHFAGWNFARIPAQSNVGRSPIQAKLMVGPVNDHYEQEADRMASKVMNMPPTGANKAAPGQVQRAEEEEQLQMKPLVQREGDEEQLQMKPQPIQRNSAAGFATDDAFENNLNRQRSGGAALPDSLRADFEPKFGADFRGIKVHNDAESHHLNKSIQAKAFTSGKDIFFRQGTYEPGSRGGQELLAHELTHTVQQGAAPLQRKSAEESKKDPLIP